MTAAIAGRTFRTRCYSSEHDNLSCERPLQFLRRII
jgi:hypothetical protein